MAKPTTIGTIPGILLLGCVVYGLISFVFGAMGHVLLAVFLTFTVSAIAGGQSKSKPGKTQSKQESGERKSFAGNRKATTSSRGGSTMNLHITVESGDFTISRAGGELENLRFHRKDESVEIHGFTLDGLVYTGKRGRNTYGEPAVLDSSLPVTHSNLVDSPGYWPDYGSLSPEQRWQYLSWLADGRGPTTELGFVFLFFYGLERYVYRDAAEDDTEARNSTLQHIVEEVERLRGQFSENRSFADYSSNLSDSIYVKFWPERLKERRKGLPTRTPVAASYAIINQANVSRDQPLDPDWALQWVLGYGNLSRTKAVRENYPLIRALFRHAYDDATKGGMTVPSCKRRAGRLFFSPASQGLDDVAYHEFSPEWFNPLELKRPLGQLEAIIGEVMPLVRKLSKALATRQLIEIMNAWPADTPMDASPHLMSIVKSLQDFLAKRSTLSGTELVKLLQLPSDTKLTSSVCRKVASALETCGYALVPDPLISPTTLKPEDALFIYQGPRLGALSPEGTRLSTEIRLGAILALADGELHDHEVTVLRKRVEANSKAEEREYLQKYVDWNLSQSPSAAGLKKQIDQLNSGQRNELADLLVEVAQADGALPKTEIRELEKLFTRLGLATVGVTEKLHGAAVHQGTGVPVTAKPTVTPESSGVTIDLGALEAHANATREVQSVLSKIFEEEDPEVQIADDIVDAAPASDAWHEGHLDENHEVLASWLLTGDEWSMEDVTRKCSELSLMPEGALTAINEAAFETLGDSLLEMGDPVEVYRDVLPS